MTQTYGKITRDLQDTGERRQFDSAPPAPGDLAGNKPYWVPLNNVTVDNSTGPNVVVEESVKEITDSSITVTTTKRDKTQAEIDAQQTAELDATMAQLQKARTGLERLAEGLFIAYNEAREGNGKQPITKQQFLTWLRGQF